ncbi:MAG: OmpA family protein [Oscillatoriales cyanobacterium]|nr:MAG: OmpA family protein [Oscillatoriales cyanobacterium]
MASLNSASESFLPPSGAETANHLPSNANDTALSPLLDLLVEATDDNPVSPRVSSHPSSVIPASISGLPSVADELQAERERDEREAETEPAIEAEAERNTLAPEYWVSPAEDDRPDHPVGHNLSLSADQVVVSFEADQDDRDHPSDQNNQDDPGDRDDQDDSTASPIGSVETLDDTETPQDWEAGTQTELEQPQPLEAAAKPAVDSAVDSAGDSPEFVTVADTTSASPLPDSPTDASQPTPNPPRSATPHAGESSPADWGSPSPGSARSPHRIKLSPQTLRQRTMIGEFVEPLPPVTPTPSQSQTPPPPHPAAPPHSPTASYSTPKPTPPVPPPPSPVPSPSAAIVPVSESRLAQLEARLIELESQLDFSDIAASKDKQIKLMPLVDEILSSLTPTALRQETIRSIIPVIDRIIIERAEQNHDAMSAAISDLMPQAIARQIESDPHAIAEAVAPEMAEAIRRQIALKKGALAEAICSEMGEAIRRQILLAREEMVDALYPVIGNTITKYMSEEIRNINAKVEQSFSLEGITRKIRAKLQGVSEAELILRDSASFTVKAAFLIHKESGLVIAEAQQPNATPLESDMIGGMLTAIRSFANDCIAQADAGNTAELNEIEYDTFKLVLEVAGYCYVALVVKGTITKSYVNHMRLVMVGLVQNYGPAIKDFDGDPSTIPDDIALKIASLVPDPIDLSQEHAKNAKHPPALVILLILGVLGGTVLWMRQSWQQRVETAVLQKIDRIPELTAYQIDVVAKGNRLELSGDLPSRSLQEKLIDVVTPLVPDRDIIDRTHLATFEPDEATIVAEVDRLTALLNRTLPATVVTQYQNRRITLKGWAEDETVLAAIGHAFETIPGVQSVSSALLIDAPPDKIRLYFELGETNPITIGERKLESVERFLREFPTLHLEVVGHADRIGTTEQNQSLSIARANRVRQLLIERGIDPKRLTARGSLELPPGIDPQQSLELSRCVRFEIRDHNPDTLEPMP